MVAQFWPVNHSMKKSLSGGVLCLLLCLSSFVSAQEAVIGNVRVALKSGSSKEIIKYFHKTTDLDFDGNSSSYGKNQAEVVLRNFFKENPPSDFKIIHKGASKAGSPYVIGQYTHKEGTYRVWIRLKEEGEDFLVHAMSFYKD